MPGWDESSPELEANLQAVLRTVRADAIRRVRPTLAMARRWHVQTMKGLRVPKRELVGRFRGEPGLENRNVAIGRHRGVDSRSVARTVAAFEAELQALVTQLDDLIPAGSLPNGRHLAAVIVLSAWAHAEWVRIHPFANGNGRTARLWANFIARRYGLPFFVRLRPRPGYGYGAAAEAAMRGDWRPTAVCFRMMLLKFLAEGTPPAA
jgi:hypothetical protein